jgi:hypothetical protein
MNTPTPRTNRAWNALGDDNAEAAWSLARTLERELAELLAVNATGAARLAHATAQLKAEREKVRALRRALGIIERKADEPANPIYPLDEVGDIATAALAATEDAP